MDISQLRYLLKTATIKVNLMTKQTKFIILFFSIIAFFACTNQKENIQTTSICVLIDVSDERFKDENFIHENLPKYFKLMNLDKISGGFSGGEMKFSLINEISDSKSKTIKIEKGEDGLMGENPLTRKDKVEKFFINVETQLTSLLKEANWGTESSKIYQKIARECIKMKRSEADKKYLIIYSDMLENSNLCSFYKSNWKNQIEKMIDEPENTLKTFAENGPALPDLSEFEIYIVAKRNAENDERINLSEQLWTGLFEFQGATVFFNSSLEI
jgi:hypothetical protein